MNALMSLLFTLALMITVSLESEGAAPHASGAASAAETSLP